MKKHNVEIITWKDALSIDPWTPASEVVPLYHTIITVGLVVASGPKVLTVSLNYDIDGDNYACFIHIPKSMILSRKKIGRV